MGIGPTPTPVKGTRAAAGAFGLNTSSLDDSLGPLAWNHGDKDKTIKSGLSLCGRRSSADIRTACESHAVHHLVLIENHGPRKGVVAVPAALFEPVARRARQEALAAKRPPSDHAGPRLQ